MCNKSDVFPHFRRQTVRLFASQFSADSVAVHDGIIFKAVVYKDLTHEV
jgi:hypothetical protein